MALTDSKVRNAKPGAKAQKLTDERGLYLLLSPNGGKWWRFDYRFNGRRKTLSLGTYPDVSLKLARERRDDARKQVEAGIDPGLARKAQKLARSGAESFEAIAREWHAKRLHTLEDVTADRNLRRLTLYIFPWLGARPIGEIEPPELLAALRRIESRGALSTAHRVKQLCGLIFRYAVATGRAKRDPTADLRGALPPTKTKHHAAVTDPKAIAGLLRALEGYTGSFVVQQALRLAPLVFVRPGELRKAEWTEIDLDKAEWRIPAARMKMRSAHIVPLSTQAVAILRELHALTGRGRLVFPSIRSNERPMSENTVNAALRRMGYAKDEMTGHGFRSMASTILHEQGWHTDIIERQLAHTERNNVKAAYNHAQHLPERRRMMQAWADYLDSIKAGADVVALKTKTKR